MSKELDRSRAPFDDVGFEELAMRYLDENCSSAQFSRFQEELRTSSERRQQFLAICDLVAGSAELADARLTVAAVPEAGKMSATTTGPWLPWAMGAAAALALLLAGILSREGADHGPSTADSPDPIMLEHDAPLPARSISLLDPDPDGFALVSLARSSIARWSDPLAAEADLRAESEVVPTGWLDLIELQPRSGLSVYQPQNLQQIRL